MAIVHGWNEGPDQIKNIDDVNFMVEMSGISGFDTIKDVEAEMLHIADNLSR
jgi:hypothetical protein